MMARPRLKRSIHACPKTSSWGLGLQQVIRLVGPTPVNRGSAHALLILLFELASSLEENVCKTCWP